MKYLKSKISKKRTDYKQETLYSSRKWRKFRQSILAEQGGCCEACGNVQPDRLLHIDHIIPIVDGGAKWDIDNLQVLCKRCHGAKTWEETIKGVGWK